MTDRPSTSGATTAASANPCTYGRQRPGRIAVAQPPAAFRLKPDPLDHRHASAVPRAEAGVTAAAATRARVEAADLPEKVEADLMQLFAPSDWTDLSHRMILHGRRVCHARKPACDECPLASLCPSYAGAAAGREALA